MTDEQRAKIAATSKGRKHTPEAKRKCSEASRRRVITDALRAKWSAARLGRPMPSMAGPRNPNWKGGATKERVNHAVQAWARAVKRRDGNRCQWCGYASAKWMHAHHVKPFAEHPEARYDIDNGITLCPPCHRTTY